MSLKSIMQSTASRLISNARISLPRLLSVWGHSGRSGATPGSSSQIDLSHSHRPMEPIWRRITIRGDIERQARLGFVSDAPIFQLHDAYVEEFDEQRRGLRHAEEALQACLRRLNALFPKPPAPEPAAPAPPRPKHLGRISGSLGQSGKPTLH